LFYVRTNGYSQMSLDGITAFAAVWLFVAFVYGMAHSGLALWNSIQGAFRRLMAALFLWSTFSCFVFLGARILWEYLGEDLRDRTGIWMDLARVWRPAILEEVSVGRSHILFFFTGFVGQVLMHRGCLWAGRLWSSQTHYGIDIKNSRDKDPIINISAVITKEIRETLRELLNPAATAMVAEEQLETDPHWHNVLTIEEVQETC
jgi:hypothetical protein